MLGIQRNVKSYLFLEFMDKTNDTVYEIRDDKNSSLLCVNPNY